MDLWHVVHDYRRLADRGNVIWPICMHCRHGLHISIGKNDQPIFACWDCSVRTEPGELFYVKLQEIIDGTRPAVTIEL